MDIRKVKNYAWTKTNQSFLCPDKEMLKEYNIIKIGTFKKTKTLDNRIEEALKKENYELVRKLTTRKNKVKRKK